MSAKRIPTLSVFSVGLIRRFWGWQMLVGSVWLFFLVWLQQTQAVLPGLVGALISGALLVWQARMLLRFLPENRADGQVKVNDGLGAANWMTIGRGALVAFLAGFLFLSDLKGISAWVPALLYLAAALLDYADGAVARLTHSMTRMGELLDIELDGLGILTASLLVVLNGQAPLLFVVVGMARYLYLWGIRVRERQGLPVFDLPPNPLRRGLAGLQMGLLAALLFPVFTPPATHIASYLLMAPFLFSFMLDYLAVSGKRVNFDLRKPIFAWLAWIWRLGLLGLVGMLLYLQPIIPVPAWLVMVLSALCIFGLAGRLAAFGLMLTAGFWLRAASMDVWGWLVLVFGILIFVNGTGRFSLWRPEDWIVYHRLGEVKLARQD
ncbi:MAG: hypothetical protein CVU39_06630 [Chloroflexi bacterium HGW-Chloroflexi-10]|nr:MAG: hypothetical protein CVU39_06630 [Chloroflexi bacterium HGW-Chloroflexi-10]